MFQRQKLVNYCCVVAGPFEMFLHYPLEGVAPEIRPRERTWVEQHLPDVIAESIPIPNAVVVELVAPEKQSFKVQAR
jgi:hypothetical protein